MNTSEPTTSWSTSSGKLSENAIGSLILSRSSSTRTSRSPRNRRVFGGAFTLRIRHFGPAMSISTRQGRSSRAAAARTCSTIWPHVRVVVGAIDPRAIHAGVHQIADQFGVRRRFGRQGRHHPGAGAASLALAEQTVGLGLELRPARQRQNGCRIGRARFPGQALERRNKRIERLCDMALAAAR